MPRHRRRLVVMGIRTPDSGDGANRALRPHIAELSRVADTLVEVYLGRDAGQRVLKGRIQRGVADRIELAGRGAAHLADREERTGCLRPAAELGAAQGVKDCVGHG